MSSTHLIIVLTGWSASRAQRCHRPSCLPALATALVLLLSLLVGGGGCSAVERIIFDSDMSSDHDDAADIAVLHALADLDECEILACMASSQNGGTAVAFNAINTYFGRPGIPCGRRPDSSGPGAYPGTLMAEFPHPLYATWQDPPLCVDLYRQVLAAQPDHSVSIVTTGYLNNLEALMKSGPDQSSPLAGMDLIRLKVKLLSCAAGCYPKGNEFNLRVEPAAAFYVVNNWPTTVFYDGYDVGQAIYSGAGLEQTGRENPIRRAFELTFFGPYPTWGQLMVYYAVRTPESRVLWDYNTTGRNNADATGYNWWSTTSDPSDAQEQGYMLEIERFPVQQALETLVMNSGAPRSRGTVKPPNQPSNLRGTIVGGDRIDLTWTDNSWNETGFTIERRVNGVFTPIATVGAGVTRYADTRLTSVANQNYRVKATNALGASDPATVAVYTGWTEYNRTNPADHTPIYHYYQNNLNWIRGPDVCEHVVVNNDSDHGQDLTIDVMVAAQGAYGKFYVYFFYQDADNWYRLSAGSQGEGPQNNVSRFEKCVGGTISPIGAPGTGVNLGNGCHLITWRITASRSGALTFANNNNPTGNASGPLHAVLNVQDTFSFSGGRIALGTNIGQPVWDDFSFTSSSGANLAPVAPAITGQPADVTLAAGQTATFT
nr:nucleoside hydrolase [Planctomycetota bacterium]